MGGKNPRTADNSNFVAIHLRSPGGVQQCALRFKRNIRLLRPFEEPTPGRPVDANDICRMSSEYIRAVLTGAGLLPQKQPEVGSAATTGAAITATTAATPPLRYFILSDGRDRQSEERIRQDFNAVRFRKEAGFGVDARHVDMLLAIRSSFFIGNPMSTYSMTIAAVRKVGWGAFCRGGHTR